MSHGEAAWGSDSPRDSIARRVAAPPQTSRTIVTSRPTNGPQNRARSERMTIKIFGHPMSTCTRKVLMTLAETNTPYEFVLVDFTKGEHKQPPHLARQPFGQVPAMHDGDFELYESRAICRYINEKVNGPLIPRDLRDRARMEQWISIETSDFTGATMKFVFHHILKYEQTKETLDTAAGQLNTALGVMDKQLAAHPFIAGGSFTLADVAFMPYFEYAMNTPAKELFTKHAHVMAWWKKVSERPTWRKIAGR
jgi:glutathione S-transferase